MNMIDYREMTREAERVLVRKCKEPGYKGRIAKEMLFGIYMPLIKAAHDRSNMGMNPKGLGYGHNVNGESFESYSGKIGMIFDRIIKDYDEDLASENTKLPFLSYLLGEIKRRGFDESVKEAEYRKRFTTTSELKRRQGADCKSTEEELLELLADRDSMFDSEREELHEAAVKEFFEMSKTAAAKIENGIAFMEAYADVGDGQEKGVMTDVSKRLYGSARKRTNLNRIRDQIKMRMLAAQLDKKFRKLLHVA